MQSILDTSEHPINFSHLSFDISVSFSVEKSFRHYYPSCIVFTHFIFRSICMHRVSILHVFSMNHALKIKGSHI